MKPYYELTGQKFGRLTVTGLDETRPHLTGRGYYWLCECECGNTKSVLASHLRAGMVKSCGCRKGRPVAKVKEEIQPAKRYRSVSTFDFTEIMPSRIAEAYYY